MRRAHPCPFESGGGLLKRRDRASHLAVLMSACRDKQPREASRIIGAVGVEEAIDPLEPSIDRFRTARLILRGRALKKEQAA